jgi:hypothetical protein
MPLRRRLLYPAELRGRAIDQYRVHAAGGIWLDRFMRAWMLLGAAVGALVIAPAASGQGDEDALERTTLVDVMETGPTEVELDGDPAPERVASRKLGDFRFAPRVEDDCLGARRLGPVNEAVAIEAIKVRATQELPFVWTSGSRGATGRVAMFTLNRLSRPIETGCPKLDTLFAFPNAPGFRMPRARRGTQPGSFSATPRVVDGQLQIRTTEGLYRRRDAGCCPSFVRTTDWRFSRERDRFVRSRSRTRPSRG